MTDYYPFGMQIAARSGSASDYRYGFNGMESDGEVSGDDNSYDFGARMYNPRIGRWFATDAHSNAYPSMSPYSAMINNPIIATDPDGKDIIIFIFASENTESGAGHSSFAVGQDDKSLRYYSNYLKSDGGGQLVEKVDLADLKSTYEKDNFTHGQSKPPVLVLRIKTGASTDANMIEVADVKITERWWLFKNNCADITKSVLDKSNYSEGIAFPNSTPNELVEDLYENNKKAFESGEITVIQGNLKEYLKNEPNGNGAVLKNLGNFVKDWVIEQVTPNENNLSNKPVTYVDYSSTQSVNEQQDIDNTNTIRPIVKELKPVSIIKSTSKKDD